MSRGIIISFSVALSLLICVSSAFGQYSASYGNLNGATVVYQQISEGTNTDSGPLFGAPSISGDSLLFSPTIFGAFASGAGGFDLTDGTLQTNVLANQNKWIDSIIFNERGDWTLGGMGTAATNCLVSAALFVSVTHLDGQPLQTPINFNMNLAFNPSDGTYNLVENPGSTQIWTGGVNFDLSAALQALGETRNATKVQISLDNSLMAFSEAGTVAQIKKKQIEGVSITATAIPEPAGLILLALGGLLAIRRR